MSSGLKTKLGNLETGSCRASESETPPAPASRPGLLLPVPVTASEMRPRLARGLGTMIWQSSSEADSVAASESELAVQAAAAAVRVRLGSDSGTRESRVPAYPGRHGDRPGAVATDYKKKLPPT